MDETTSRANVECDLRIRLMGGFQVAVGPRVIGEAEWRLRKAKSLVKLLALAPGHRLHREQVMELLWPGSGEEVASRNFRKVLHFARHTLEPGLSDASRFLHVQDGLLALRSPDALWVDVEAFEAASSLARRTGDARSYLAAIELYAGDLLPEDLYEDWTALRRDELRGAYLQLLIELAQTYSDSGDPESAIEAYRRVIAAEPTSEEAHEGLIRAYALAGRRHAALQQYEQLRDMLKRELDIEPGDTSRQLYQEILDGHFPTIQSPIRNPQSAIRTRHNLPAQLTSFVGREAELAEVGRLLASTRLLTLTGPGGSGKTRLALEVAATLVDEYRDGVWLVELAALFDPEMVPLTVASVLGVREQPDRALTDTLAELMRPRKLLLILDNCEHLIDICAQLVDTLLRACPGLRILATSRESLGITGETAWLVPSLSLPDPAHLPAPTADLAEALMQYESVRLFVDRATTVRQGLRLADHNAPSVARICHSLDGIPLAIELAAARVKILSVEQIAERLVDSVPLLTGGSRTALPRQQTLRATIDWSYELLSEKERTLFRRLSVFAGGFSLEGVEAVCPGAGLEERELLDTLSHLVDKSLVTLAPDTSSHPLSPPQARYRLLETLRQYSSARLMESGEVEETERRHALYYLALAERAEVEMRGHKQIAWLERLDQEHDNLRAALEWSHQHDDEMGLRIGGSLWWYWDIRGYHSEGRRWLAEPISQFQARTGARARALNSFGALAGRQGDVTTAISSMTESLAIYREIGDRAGAALALESMGLFSYLLGDYEESRRLLHEGLALYRELGNELMMGWVLSDLGMLARVEEDYEQAWTFSEEAYRYLREYDDRRGLAYALNNLGQLMRIEGNYTKSQALLEESLAAAREVGDKPFTGWALKCLGEVARRQGHVAQARDWFVEGMRILRDIGNIRHTAQALCALGVMAVQQNDHRLGVQLISAAVATHEEMRTSLDADENAAWDESIVAARAVLGETEFDTAWTEGQAMTLDQAINYALTISE